MLKSLFHQLMKRLTSWLTATKWIHVKWRGRWWWQTHRQLSPTLWFPSTPLCILVSFRSLFWFYGPRLYCLSGLSTTQLDIGLPNKQTTDSSDWWSHLLHSSPRHRSPPGLCPQPPAVHAVHPWLQYPTWTELCCEVRRWHHHHQPDFKQWWDFILGGNQ